MLILSLAETESVTLSTPWGKEQGIRYGGSAFLPTQSYQTLAAAIAVCRKDLDAGLMSIVVKEGDIVRLWCPLPELMQIRKVDLVA
jgi:hypothetical protein